MAGTDIYESHPHRRTFALLTPVCVWLFIFGGVWLSSRVAALIGLNVSAGSGRWQDNVTALFASAPVLLALWLWLRFFERRGFSGIGLGAFQAVRFAGGLLTGAILIVPVIAAGVALGGYELSGPGAWYDHLTPTWLFAVVLVLAGTVVQALTTEALFRGWMLQTVAAQWGVPLAVLVNVIATFVIQGGNFMRAPEALVGAVNLSLMAWILCGKAVREGSLWGVCGLHTAWNLTIGLAFGLNIDGGHLNVTPMILSLARIDDAPWWLTGGDFGPDASIALTVLAGVWALWGARGKGPGRQSRREERFDPHDEIMDH